MNALQDESHQAATKEQVDLHVGCLAGGWLEGRWWCGRSIAGWGAIGDGVGTIEDCVGGSRADSRLLVHDGARNLRGS